MGHSSPSQEEERQGRGELLNPHKHTQKYFGQTSSQQAVIQENSGGAEEKVTIKEGRRDGRVETQQGSNKNVFLWSADKQK